MLVRRKIAVANAMKMMTFTMIMVMLTKRTTGGDDDVYVYVRNQEQKGNVRFLSNDLDCLATYFICLVYNVDGLSPPCVT